MITTVFGQSAGKAHPPHQARRSELHRSQIAPTSALHQWHFLIITPINDCDLSHRSTLIVEQHYQIAR
jgi:hypothetical protein